MAVVPSGFFGEYYNQYDRLNSSRNWNTKSYDYAVVKNKGEISEEARNEDSTNYNPLNPNDPNDPDLFGKGLFVKTNKNMYIDASGAIVEEKDNPIYQIRDSNDKVNNNYYVDQKTGNVYFRPLTNGNAISLPASTPIKPTEAQYFGTTFNLERIPNPEEFGNGVNPFTGLSRNNINLIVNGSTAKYSELIINGVPIQVGNLNTSLLDPVTGANATNTLFMFSNSFIAGTDNFSPISGNWSYDSTNGNYVVAGVGQTNFNQRTLDNFMVSVEARNQGGGNGRNVGLHLRANSPSDSIGTSGYYVYIDNGGNVRINKAGYPGGDVPLLANITSNGNLNIRMNGTEIIVNNTVLFRDDNETLYGKPYLDGYLSLRSTDNITKTFDNFEVKSYPTAIQLISRALKEGENSIVVRSYDDAAVNVSLTGSIRDFNGTTPRNINLNTGNPLPDLNNLAALSGSVLDITSRFYREDSISGSNTYLDDDRAYWSVSQRSALGIAGKIVFTHKDGGSIHKTKDQFMGVNSLMQNLTNLLGTQDDLFNSHLGIIR